MTTNGTKSTAANGHATTQQFLVPSYPRCPAKHWRFATGKFRGMRLSQTPGWYLTWILYQPNLDHTIRALIFETLMTARDRRFAVNEIIGDNVTKLLDAAEYRNTSTR